MYSLRCNDTPGTARVEFRCVSQYSDYADAFVRQVPTVCAPAGGEMSGLIAHFLFGANSRETHTGHFELNPLIIISLQVARGPGSRQASAAAEARRVKKWISGERRLPVGCWERWRSSWTKSGRRRNGWLPRTGS